MKKDYSMLSQNERDPEDYVVKPQQRQERRRSCFMGLFVVLAIIVMLGGAIALVAGLFYSNEVNGVINQYWDKGGQVNTTILPESGLKNSSEEASIHVTGTPSVDLSLERNHTKAGNSSETTSDEEDDWEDGDETEDEEEIAEPEEEQPITTPVATTRKPVKKQPHKIPENSAAKNDSGGILSRLGIDGKVISDTQEEVAETAIKVERFLENVTGIHRAELLIPLFMLLCFTLSIAMASCCCYIVMRRRENQRRRVLGKIITDLQTGDSKSVLLDQDADD